MQILQGAMGDTRCQPHPLIPSGKALSETPQLINEQKRAVLTRLLVVDVRVGGDGKGKHTVSGQPKMLYWCTEDRLTVF